MRDAQKLVLLSLSSSTHNYLSGGHLETTGTLPEFDYPPTEVVTCWNLVLDLRSDSFFLEPALNQTFAMPPSAAHRRPPPETASDTGMRIFSDDRTQPQDVAANAALLQGEAFSTHIVQYVKSIVGPYLVNRQDPYLKDSELKRLNIQVTGLDLEAGAATSAARFPGQFLIPFSPANVGQLLGPFGLDNRDWLPLSGQGSIRESRYAEAKDVFTFLDNLIIEDSPPMIAGHSSGPPILTRTPWRWYS